MKRIDLNVDVGEGFGSDEALLDLATSANVCCGQHAGSWELTLRTIEHCNRKGVRIGVHPGFPDRDSMGRGEVPLPQADGWFGELRAQVDRFVKEQHPAYIKPHGAWYSMLAWPENFRAALVGRAGATLASLCFTLEIPVMLFAGAPSTLTFRKIGCSVIDEGFADRGYTPDGQLVPRGQAGDLLDDPAQVMRQVLELAPQVESICVHSDSPNSLQLAELVLRTLRDAGFEVGA
ncbi:MAG: LamB/YcsF family protein [Fimbriimonas ginsengisoli]|uniref:LamB/YcsF family protein n=1 Tax=Fimbriimonas ginsengisoli TaxID=1005039 RepID=A0A931LTR3_FIMGI|nr:LamB/YcsF family protein [Fimbriimonas ginsengisoli]